MQNYAIANKLTPFISLQNHYNLIYREEEREMFPTLKVRSPSILPNIADLPCVTDVRCRKHSVVSARTRTSQSSH